MFPENYPTALYKVSYKFEENIGILNNWNKHCDTCKENPYFVFQCIKNYVFKKYFFDKQTIPVEVYELIKYISSCLSVKWTDDEFIVKFKKEEANGKYKDKFKENEYFELTEKAYMKKKDAVTFLKDIIEYLKKFYNNVIISYNKNLKNNK